jgi:integrase
VRRKTRRVTIGPYGPISPEVARKKAMELLAQMAGGIDPNEAKRATHARAMTVQVAFEAFFAARPNFSPVTVDAYSRTRDLYLKDWRTKPISEITRPMVLARHRRVSEVHGAVTANNAFRHLRSVYNFIGAAHGELPPNPVAILSQARVWAPERRRQTLVAQHSLPAWWRAASDDTATAGDFLKVALLTGMRRNEIAGLRWQDIDLIAETLTVPKTKNGDPLVLPLSWFLVDLLIARRQLDPDGEWVFPGCGKTGHIVEVKSFVSRVAKESGVPFMIHDLRRTFSTVAESLDIPHYALKRLLNHRISGDVTGGYLVLDAERLRGPVNRVADRILELAHERQEEPVRAT